MNIYTFRIEIKSWKKKNNMEEEIINRFRENSSEEQDYHTYVLECWRKEAENIRLAYSEENIVATAQEGLSKYYVKKVQKNDDLKKVQFEIVVVSHNEEINNSISSVYKSLKRKLRFCNLSICDNKAMLYITDGKDILILDVLVKAKYVVNRWDFSVRELFRLILVAMTFIITLVITIINSDELAKSIMVSCAFWLISEPIVKIRWTRELEVSDLTNCFTPREEVLGVAEDKKIMAPLVEEWGVS